MFKYVYAAIPDFSKVFGVVPHQCLQGKLQHCGIQRNVHSWIASFLMECKCVMVDGDHTKHVHVDPGVPQGTAIGPFCSSYTLTISVINLSYTFDCLQRLVWPIRCAADQGSCNMTSKNSATGQTLCAWNSIPLNARIIPLSDVMHPLDPRQGQV